MNQIIITGSETMIDRLKKKGYNVRNLDIGAPIDTFNPLLIKLSATEQEKKIDNVEEKGYNVKIMEDTEIIGNMLKNVETEPMMRLQKQVRRANHLGVSSELCIQNNEDYPYDYSLHAISLVSNPKSELSLGYPFPDPEPMDFSKLPLDSKF